jgi:dihydrodipicolinate synthase/N-acetylneuraminate lyase
MGALGSRFHEYQATQSFDGTLSGFWNYAEEPMMDHLDAWDRMDVPRANEIWNGGLSDLQSYIADFSRLHIRYKIASWLVGHCASPLMRQPMPKPRQVEIDTIYSLLQAAGIQTIDKKDTRMAA